MSSIWTWLTGKKKFYRLIRAHYHFLSPNCRNLLFLPPSSIVNYSAYLSSCLQKKFTKDNTPSSPKVPRQRRGTFSFYGTVPPALPPILKKPAKIIWLWNIAEIPSHRKIALAKIAQKHRSSVISESIFSPRNFSYDLAKNNDWFFVKKHGWRPVIWQIITQHKKLACRGDAVPEFPPRFSLRERLVLRILWKFRHRLTSLEEISSYVYGRRFYKNLHASEVIIAGLRKKLKKLFGRRDLLNNYRSYGYHIDKDIWKDISKF
ncbi:MAG: helix-turn-helix domain-containing protein [Candidatus Moranbacteria bacterium]|nr:helix-turn-helix domain-containing protein [Candidatus Moranbacteria bacterium]